MSDLYAKCPTCGRVWLVAALPMDAQRVAFLGRRAACAHGCTAKPVVAPVALSVAPDPSADPAAEAARVLLARIPNPIFDNLKPVLMGEFKEVMAVGQDEEGNEIMRDHHVSWTTTKDIIRAALRVLAQGQPEC